MTEKEDNTTRLSLKYAEEIAASIRSVSQASKKRKRNEDTDDDTTKLSLKHAEETATSIKSISQASKERKQTLRASSDTEAEDTHDDADDITDGDHQSNPTKIDATTHYAIRNNPQSHKRLAIDEASCIITGMANPEVCHIIPFSANEKPTTTKKLFQFFSCTGSVLFPGEDGRTKSKRQKEAQRYFASAVGVSDHKWNMVSLNRQLHEWWGRAFFALKCLDISDAPPDKEGKKMKKLKLQFHWMPWRRTTDEPLLGLTTADMFSGAFSRSTNGNPLAPKPTIAALRVGSGQPVITGDIFYAHIDSEHAEKMKLAFDIQWAIIQMTAIAGGAEALELVGDDPDYLKDGEFPGIRAQWQAALGLYFEDVAERREVSGKGKNVDRGNEQSGAKHDDGGGSST